jgi:hypothetical protein
MRKENISKKGVEKSPRLNFLQTLYILNCLRNIPDLVRVNHQHGAGGSSVLSFEIRAIGIPRLKTRRKVLRVIDDGTDNLSTTNVVGLVSSDFHFEVVETHGDGFLGEPSDFFIRVSCRCG